MPPALPDFVPLAPRTFLYTPSHATKGYLIILCTWLGASQKHIAKYTSLHRHLFPSTRILVLESSVTSVTATYARQRSALQPAAAVVTDILNEPPTAQPKILLHVFSNGGLNTATHLLLALRSLRAAPLPLHALVLDSCPAAGTFWASYRAMLFAFPRNALLWRVLAPVAVISILLALYAWILVDPDGLNPATLGRRTLLDAKMVSLPRDRGSASGGGSEGPSGVGGTKGDEKADCLLLYSKEDEMVDWRDVEAFAEEARRARAWRVRGVRFEGSGHCAHMALDEGRYGGAVERMWGD